MGKKDEKAKKKGKRVRKGRKHETKKANAYYEIKGSEITRKRPSCPRCGPGIFLAGHKGRNYCGSCGYTEFDRKEAPKAEKPEEKKQKPEAKKEKPNEPAKTEEKKSA